MLPAILAATHMSCAGVWPSPRGALAQPTLHHWLTGVLGAQDAHLRANLVGSRIAGLVMAGHIVGLVPLASTAPEGIAQVVAPTLERYLLEPLI
jgi:hypothetical protein